MVIPQAFVDVDRGVGYNFIVHIAELRVSSELWTQQASNPLKSNTPLTWRMVQEAGAGVQFYVLSKSDMQVWSELVT